ncbi:damage-inducible protein DinB [Vibrio sp. 10N.286.49.C2]|uniref:DinB family protein n=1 Tax=unclassified Vibrio TaxID=2614977 RepID=UPI000C855163|nr:MULTISPECIES: DinB family protein [unclassified Vibrio]PMH40754.1 damage-inducible protein DinB [Vibrio sp. 10N.286.49.C2]PMH45285.1 damage-inducible protein DinB [Vibrio sp. 10N.286.49.B1]PMH80006.1 damage-inducible protein DinB [Vibrio sp. 10N.286.48.B7]
MDLSSNFRMLALYNQRMNKQLVGVCRKLTHEQLHQNINSFFPTIMAHWNHILFGDLIMLQRLVANELVTVEATVLDKLPVSKSVSDTYASNLDELSELRELVDSIYIKITNQFTADSCNQIVRYTTTEGQIIERTVGEFCQHVFNHQTHHRGQLTCLLSQFGLDFGCTDLPVIVPEGART